MAMSKKKPNELKSSDVNVLESIDCRDMSIVTHGLSSSDPVANVTTIEDDPNDIGAEVISKQEERLPKITNRMTIRFAEEQQIILVKLRLKAPDHKKMAHRQIPNPWRRFGSLKALYAIGGWVTPRGRDQRLFHVEPGTPPPNDPKVCHLSLHQDIANLNQEFFKFRLNRTSDSQTVAHSVGQQISDSCQVILRSKQQPPKKSQKKFFDFFRHH